MPICPRCDSQHVKRAGFANDRQVYYCHDCARRFMGKTFKLVIAEVPILLCYRCGSTDVKPHGFSQRGGRTGHCNRCNRKFVQGGRFDLQRYHLHLAQRIRALKLPPAVEEEAMQQAAADVMGGQAYCWNVKIQVSKALRAVWGEYGQLGSSHQEFKQKAG